MAINQKEIERIVDDIQTKIEELNKIKTEYVKTGMWVQADFNRERIEGMEYCLAVIRQVTP